MAAKKKGPGTAQAVRALAEPLAAGLGLALWDVRFVKEGADWYLRIYIDKKGGVTIDDCVAMTHAVSDPLDEQDLVPGAYTLEVSSPGINRQLTRTEHFTACIGQPVWVRFIRPFADGSREAVGTLLASQNGAITLQNPQGETMEVPLADTAWVKLYDDDTMEENNEDE
ncbi:MAG: ribosome maturation factor RimP [Oscillospiraceae bacterium]|jgi:ribosome maturation factor RimP|nr:ribosome maturation factor RimP [Oscillospiraceae bacterium]MDD3260593.1 ribosome maturation factor RimP [Oscillospiraceae bacterium]